MQRNMIVRRKREEENKLPAKERKVFLRFALTFNREELLDFFPFSTNEKTSSALSHNFRSLHIKLSTVSVNDVRVFTYKKQKW